MSKRYPGGFLTGDEPTVNQTEADGIWTLDQQAGYKGQNEWPLNRLLVERSLRFNSADSAYLSRTPASAGTRTTWTYSVWVKRGNIASGVLFHAPNTTSGTAHTWCQLDSSHRINFYDYTGSVYNFLRQSTPVFRDPSAWYHFVFVVDSNNGTAANRARVYVNGEEITAWDTSTTAASGFSTSWNNNILHQISSQTGYYDGYITEVNFIDGLALDPSYFGQTNATTGVWTPIRYEGSYGVNGFYLPFNNNSSVPNLGLSAIPYTSDQGWNRTSLLLNTNGVDADQNNTFLDSSSNNFTITRNGNTTQGRFSPFSDGWSNYFDGTGDYLSVPYNAALEIGASSFCIEGWIYLNALPASNASSTILGKWGASVSYIFQVFNDSGTIKLAFAYSTNGGSVAAQINEAAAVTTNTWHHVAVTRDSTTLRVFLDGVQQGSNQTVSATFYNGSSSINIGRNETGNINFINGYVSNVRLVIGSAVYTSGFTPSGPLTNITNTALLTCQSNRFVDNSTNNFAITRNGDVKVTAFNPFTPTQGYSAAVNGGSGYFDGGSDYLQVSDAALALGTDDFSIQFWVYANAFDGSSGYQALIDYRNGTQPSTQVLLQLLNGQLLFYVNGSTRITGSTLTLNQWYFIGLSRESGTSKLFVNGTQVGSNYTDSNNYTSTVLRIGADNDGTINQELNGYMSGLKITQGASVNFSTLGIPTAPPTSDANTSLLLNFTNAGIVDATGLNDLETVGNAQVDTAVTKWGSSVKFDGTGDYLLLPNTQDLRFGAGNFTVECWVYPTASPNQPIIVGHWSGSTGGTGLSWVLLLSNNSSRNLRFALSTNGSGVLTDTISSTPLSLNTWSHVALVRNGNVFTIYLNGVAATGGSYTISAGTALYDATNQISVGASSTGSEPFQGYIEDVRITKGLARYTGNFTVPDAPFAYDKSDINYKQWVPNNFSVSAGAGNDSMVDTPTPYGTDTGAGGEVRGNYCTLNPLDKTYSSDTYSEGNLKVVGGYAYAVARGTMALPPTGKWYYEGVYTVIAASGAANPEVRGFGFVNINKAKFVGNESYVQYSGVGYVTGDRSSSLQTDKNIDGTRSTYGTQIDANDIIGIAADFDSDEITFYNNGVSQGTFSYDFSAGGTGPLWVPVSLGGSNFAAGTTVIFNFGQRPFAYAAPSGFKALCTENLPTPTIADGGDYFNTVLYSGNSSTQAITGVGFAPDFIWVKGRNTTARNRLFNVISGVQKELYSDLTNAEATDVNGIQSFDSDGFTLGSNDANTSGTNYVGWNWNAGGSNATNTDGTITSTVRANTTAGFSVVSYTASGSTFTTGHGLGVAPAMIIHKIRNNGALNWLVYHQSLGGNAYLSLNTTAASATLSGVWTTSSTTFGSNYAGANPTVSGNHIAYCFAEVEGFSKFGSYTGNGVSDGPFVYCGFRPAFILYKQTNTTRNWHIVDAVRDSYNVGNKQLYPNSTSAEYSDAAYNYDILSNGFKLRGTDVDMNQSGGTYIFAAFAENPLKYSLAR